MSSATTMMLIASTAMTAFGTIQGGIQAKKSADANAANLRNAAESRRLAANEKATREARLAAKRQGNMRAADPNKLDLIEDSAMEEELALLSIRHAGEVDATGKENSANLERFKGSNAMTGAVIGAAGSVLMGGSELDMFNSTPTTPLIAQTFD